MSSVTDTADDEADDEDAEGNEATRAGLDVSFLMERDGDNVADDEEDDGNGGMILDEVR